MNIINEFTLKGFIVVKNIIDTSELYKSMLKIKDQGQKDEQCPLSDSFYNGEIIDLHVDLLPSIEKCTGLKLFKTYCYSRIYPKGEILRVHSDRDACEISATLCIGYKGNSWGLWIVDYDEEPHCVELLAGDIMIYHGIDLKHWRSRNKVSYDHIQGFMHYVNQNGLFANLENDKR